MEISLFILINQSISKQNNLNYIGIILDDNLIGTLKQKHASWFFVHIFVQTFCNFVYSVSSFYTSLHSSKCSPTFAVCRHAYHTLFFVFFDVLSCQHLSFSIFRKSFKTMEFSTYICQIIRTEFVSFQSTVKSAESRIKYYISA